MNRLMFPLTLLVLLSIGLPPCFAEEKDRVAILTWENDSLVRSGDSGYTSGLKLSYLGHDHSDPTNAFYRCLADVSPGVDTQLQKFGVAVGQTMYTPTDLSRSDLIVNDRPYAGWLYFGLLYRRFGYFPGDTEKKFPVLESFELDLGVVGPYSLAEDVQKFVHHRGGWQEPRGWGNQLKNEPGAVLDYLRFQVFPIHLYKLRFDLIPTVGISLGNIATQGDIGGLIRIGFNTPKGVIDFPSGTSITTPLSIKKEDADSKEQPQKNFGGYLFAGAEGRAVLYNTFLDGNMFRTSHSVDKKSLVGDLKAGIVLIFKRWEFSYTYVYRTKEFYGQPVEKSFGSVSFKHYF